MFENVVSAVEVTKDFSYRLHKVLQARIGFVLIIDVVKWSCVELGYEWRTTAASNKSMEASAKYENLLIGEENGKEKAQLLEHLITIPNLFVMHLFICTSSYLLPLCMYTIF